MRALFVVAIRITKKPRSKTWDQVLTWRCFLPKRINGPDTKAIASLPPGNCLGALDMFERKIYNFLVGCRSPIRKCLGALTFFKNEEYRAELVVIFFCTKWSLILTIYQLTTQSWLLFHLFWNLKYHSYNFLPYNYPKLNLP